MEWGETDAAGIVFYPNYYKWFDRAAHELCGAVGYPLEAMLASGHAVPLIEARARFLQPLAYGDEIEIRTSVGELRTRTFRLDHRIVRGGGVTCEGHEVRIYARINERAGISGDEIPPSFRDRLAASMGT